MGYNKLIEEWRARMAEIRDKLKFVIRSLTDQQARYILMAYNSLQQRAAMLNGAGMSNTEMLKIQLIKRLTNKGYNLQVMGVNAIREFLTDARYQEEMARLEFERQAKEKDRILRRIMNGNLRMLGTAFRQALQWTIADREAEIARVNKQRGICNRIVDSNVRLMSAGYNKLIEEWKARQAALREKLRFVIAALTDKDKQFTLMAYNGIRQRCLMLNGVGMGDAEMKKVQLIKRLTNQGHNLQVMGVNAIREYLKSEQYRDEAARLE